jgi:hypothetical protein
MRLTGVLELNGMRSNVIRISQTEKIICRYYGDTPTGYYDISRHFLLDSGFWFFEVVWCAVDRFENPYDACPVRFRVQENATILFKLSKCV